MQPFDEQFKINLVYKNQLYIIVPLPAGPGTPFAGLSHLDQESL